MKLTERVEYAEDMLARGVLTNVDQYMSILKGTFEDQIEDKINTLTAYLLSRRVLLATK